MSKQRIVFVEPKLTAEDSKNLQILKDISVREDYMKGNKWFTSEYLDAASRRNGGWSPLYAIISFLVLGLIMGAEMLAVFTFWIIVFMVAFLAVVKVCELINDFITEVIFEIPHFWAIAFLSGTTWVLYHVISFYSKS